MADGAAKARRNAERAEREAAPWVERLARWGYAAKGVVYGVVGIVAVRAAVQAGERPEGAEGALVAILRQPFGRVLLAVIAVGLVGYVLWRLVQAALDPEHKGTGVKGIGKRIGYVISGVLYGLVMLQAVRLVLDPAERGGDGERAEDWTARVMQVPAGRWILGIVGVGIILFGLYELYKAYTAKFRKRLDLSSLEEPGRRWAVRSGRIGLAARGVVFGVIGWFLLRAAVQYQPREAAGLREALRALANQPHGPYLLGAVGVGLVAYGVFEGVKARYRRIHPES